MLTIATLGMAGYGLYSLGSGLLDLLWTSRLALFANLSAISLGAMLVLAGLFIRAVLPGSLALALAALFGLQSLALHNAAHLSTARSPQSHRSPANHWESLSSHWPILRKKRRRLERGPQSPDKFEP